MDPWADSQTSTQWPSVSSRWVNVILQIRSKTPLGRFGQPEDVAYAALYLASDESSFVTGSELVIDGGRTAE